MKKWKRSKKKYTKIAVTQLRQTTIRVPTQGHTEGFLDDELNFLALRLTVALELGQHSSLYMSGPE
jgi:hypothetical protein